MKIFLATWCEDNQGVTLTKAWATNRLLSYYFCRQQADKFNLPEYVTTGLMSKKEGRKE